jgi:hypothetical protein
MPAGGGYALVWAVGIAIGALMIFATAGSVAKAGADLAARATTATAANSDSIAYYADALMRPAPRPAAAAGQGNTPASTARIEPLPQETRGEIARIVSRSVATGSLADNDRSYLSAIVAQRPGFRRAPNTTHNISGPPPPPRELPGDTTRYAARI